MVVYCGLTFKRYRQSIAYRLQHDRFRRYPRAGQRANSWLSLFCTGLERMFQTVRS